MSHEKARYHLTLRHLESGVESTAGLVSLDSLLLADIGQAFLKELVEGVRGGEAKHYEPCCATCGRLKSDHPYRHPFRG